MRYDYIYIDNKPGLGYGVVVNYHDNDVAVVYNHFDYNRHSIAAHGEADENYVSAYNLTFNNEMTVEYDMHGYSDIYKNDCENYLSATHTVKTILQVIK